MDVAVNHQHGSEPALEARAAEASRILKLVANQRRLVILSHLQDVEEATVGDLADFVGLGQSAMSQHLARLREDGLVTCRREGQAAYYRIDDQRVTHILGALRTVFS